MITGESDIICDKTCHDGVLAKTDFIFLINAQPKSKQGMENTCYATESRDFLLNSMEEVRIAQ